MPQRTGPTPERLALAQRVGQMRAEGRLFREIQAELGISYTYAQQLATDPDGSLARARKDSYGGTCLDCGARTTGSDGPRLAPDFCDECSHRRQHEGRRWTREAVIDAIQRFAEIHGRPPIADDWIRSDPVHGYPPRSAVYRSTGGWKQAPFASWAAAIEAAGFDRPTTGRRTRMPKRYGYVVLRERESGVWEEVSTLDEHSQILALNAALNGHDPEGRWVAVPGRSWEPRSLRPKTIYEFVSEDASA